MFTALILSLALFLLFVFIVSGLLTPIPKINKTKEKENKEENFKYDKTYIYESKKPF